MRLSTWLGLALVLLLSAAFSGGAWANHNNLTLRSTGSSGGNGATSVQYVGASADGRHVFFRTSEALVAADTDSCQLPTSTRPCFDIYEHFGGTAILSSIGPAGGNGGFDANFSAASADGTRVFFTTGEPMVSADTDNTCGIAGGNPCSDVYARSADTSTLLTTGPTGGNGPFETFFAAASKDGSRLSFGTSERLVAADTDSAEDVYQNSAGGTSIVSIGPAGGNGAFDAFLSGSSAEGTRIFFRTAESLASSDSDAAGDVYERSGSTTTLVSTGPAGGNGTPSAHFDGASADGARVFFTTEESLVAADTDNQEDVYQRAGGATTLVSTGTGNGALPASFEGTSRDGTRVFFRTRSPIGASDSDTSSDVYERSGGTTTLISTGPAGGNGAFDTAFAGASEDGTTVFFTSAEGLVSTDIDGKQDIYQRLAGVTTLISTGPAGGNGAFEAYFSGASTDGSRVFFHTDEALANGDTDGLQDVYERWSGGTTLISSGSNGGKGAFFVGASEDGKRVFFYSGEQLAAGDTDSQQDIYEAGILAGYARPKAATPVGVQLVPAYEPCTGSNSGHGPPLVGASCNPPREASRHLTIGTPDANGNPAKFAGRVSLTAVGESPIDTGNGDQADVAIDVLISDVRRQADLLDYSGELQLNLGIRITDKLNGTYLNDPATASDTVLSIPVPCVATPDTTIGSSCNTSTTLEAIRPGAVTEAQRSIWQLAQLEVRDGGADGQVFTEPNTLFLQQGLFTP